MPYKPENPMVVQSDRTILLEVDNPRYEDARDRLARFAELEKSPEHMHTYRITPLSLWNAAASGLSASEVLDTLGRFSKYEIPQNIEAEVMEYISRYGKLQLCRSGEKLVLSSTDAHIIKEIWHNREVRPYLKELVDGKAILVEPRCRGYLKQELIKFGLPVEDLAGYVEGAPLTLLIREKTRSGRKFQLRPYQQQAVEVFHASGGATGGSGVIVLPCGAGKTIVGMAAIEKLQTQTLVLVTNITALRQWEEELLDKTTLSADQIGEYSGEKKEVRPVTIATYNILTYRRSREEDFPHFELFNRQNWGLVIYDEVHLLPAPVFRITAEIQARRRLGLTATLVREDGRETDVFSLIGPKKYDVPWKILEKQGWIAPAECWEIRVELPPQLRLRYAATNLRKKFRVASENPAKDELVIRLVHQHRGAQILVIGQYIAQLENLARKLNAPIITGKVGSWERIKLYNMFKRGEIKLLVVSKVANFAVDLPDANVAIQVSGTFGSRQEEAQRLGRILRPKTDGSTARFYSLVTRNTTEQEFAANRQLFLTEQGYKYTIQDATVSSSA
ncbi:MAG: helicase [Candidatus Latescibacterota bacterium]|nr:MAG: helicase [Candidatus Latescibacterota bacterium]RKY70005.1 MAG: helicase [Candidatus Latescibacterota bacterium]